MNKSKYKKTYTKLSVEKYGPPTKEKVGPGAMEE
jgi:hypothetical protein